MRTHGGHNYTNGGCRCAVCRAAHAEYQHRARRKRWAARESIDGHLIAPGPRKHGLPSTYSNWGCKCPACLSAWADYCKATYHNRKARRAESK